MLSALIILEQLTKRLKTGDLRAGNTVLINGATGSLGTDATVASLAMGAGKIIAVGRNIERLEGLKRSKSEPNFYNQHDR